MRDILDLQILDTHAIRLLDMALNESNRTTLQAVIVQRKHSNKSNLIHHIDTVQSCEDPLGIRKRIMVYPENRNEAEAFFDLISLHVIKDLGEEGADAKKWFTEAELEKNQLCKGIRRCICDRR